MTDYRQQREYRHWLRQQERDLDLPRWEFGVADHELMPKEEVSSAEAIFTCSLGIIAVGLGIFGCALKLTGPADEPVWPAYDAPPASVKQDLSEQAERFWAVQKHELGHLRGLDDAGRTR